MSDKPTKKRRSRTRQTYQYHKNAVCISVYDPAGATLPPDVRQALENSVWAVAQANHLLINIAYE